MRRVLIAIAFLGSVVTGAAGAAVWGGDALYSQYAQPSGPKGRPAPGQGYDRGDRRDARQDRRDDRRERLTEDERRSLHRDLDKANRELYGRRFQK